MRAFTTEQTKQDLIFAKRRNGKAHGNFSERKNGVCKVRFDVVTNTDLYIIQYNFIKIFAKKSKLKFAPAGVLINANNSRFAKERSHKHS